MADKDIMDSNMGRKTAAHNAELKMTPARRGVLQILESGKQLPARDIWRRLLAVRADAGFATVYRALSALSAAGLVRRIPSDGGALYEKSADDSLPQLICSRCGKVEDINDPGLLRYNASVIKNRSLPERDRLLLYADCNRKGCAGDS